MEELEKSLLPPNPELDNFLHQVEEISQVIRGLSSDDRKENERALRKADILVQCDDEFGSGNARDRDIDEDKVRVKSSRTIINKLPDKPTHAEGGGDMSQDAFMRMVEKDANERAENRRLRQEKSDKFRDEGNKSFANGDYAGALDKYSKALELVKDMSHLYNNRALTYLRLNLYSKAIEDCDKALYISENNLKARLYKAKALYKMGNVDDARKLLAEALEKCPDSQKMIERYEKEIFNTEI